jgi:hypothetical protein
MVTMPCKHFLFAKKTLMVGKQVQICHVMAHRRLVPKCRFLLLRPTSSHFLVDHRLCKYRMNTYSTFTLSPHQDPEIERVFFVQPNGRLIFSRQRTRTGHCVFTPDWSHCGGTPPIKWFHGKWCEYTAKSLAPLLNKNPWPVLGYITLCVR